MVIMMGYDKKIICVDFDGVLNNYNGWMAYNELGVPKAWAKEFLEILKKEFTVYIFTTRDRKKVMNWLDKYDMVYDYVTDIKVDAINYIDDRAITFKGNYEETLKEIRDFNPYWEV